MSTPRAKVLEYTVSLDERNRFTAEAGPARPLPDEFAAEHLVLSGLVRCTRTILEYHAKRIGVAVTRVQATAESRVTRRESDGRYAFVEIACRFDVSLDPRPDAEALAALLAKAERDCFVGASLTAAPSYDWTVA